MKRIYFASVLFAVVVLSGCGITQNLTTNGNVTQTNVELASNNYRIVKQVQGSAQATYVLGIGGLSRRALADNSYANMVKQAGLKGSQAIINITTEQKIQFYVVFGVRKFITYATVIEFISPVVKAPENVVAMPEKPGGVSAANILSQSAIYPLTTDQKQELKSTLEMELVDDCDYLLNANKSQICAQLPLLKMKIEMYKFLCNSLQSSGYLDFDTSLKGIEQKL